MPVDPLAASIPTIASLSESASFAKTVQPFLSQLRTLPIALFNASTTTTGSKLEAISVVYLYTNPLIFTLFLSLALCPLFLLLSEVNKNYSQVDRAWSILPAVFVGNYTLWAHLHNLPTAKLDNASVCVFVWSLRLSFNYWRKGGYSIGSEDYRWEVLRKHLSAAQMFLFNVFFISFAQIVR
jgi:steroid 5-alpha reductase family enzyme